LEALLSGALFHKTFYENLLIIPSYFMPVMLEDIGITGQNQQLLMNALNTVFSFLGGIFGSFMVDRLGRRNLFLWATFLTGLCYIALNIIAWKASATGNVSTGTGYAFIAMIFLYGIFYSFGCKYFHLYKQSTLPDLLSQGRHFRLSIPPRS
jgi:MFS family permease